MKIIQSFWAGNIEKATKDSYGWLHPKYNWMSWILSANQLNKFYDVELYTDKLGYEILIQKLQLPYSKVHVVLDDLNTYHPDLWALAKIKAYSLQQEPFLHVDGDVFIWDQFPEEFSNAELIAQNLEITTEYYENMWEEISPNLEFTPSEMQDYANGSSKLACNMGIVGGSNINFFKEYTHTSFEFVDRNKNIWDNINCVNFNIFFEQVLFHEFTRQNKNSLSFQFQEVFRDNEYHGLADFNAVPFQKNYLHLIGFYKRNPLTCNQLENYVLKYYPEYYQGLENIDPDYLNSLKSTLPDYSFSTEENTAIIAQFESNLTTNSKVDKNYLFQRDLFSLEQPMKYYFLRMESHNFNLKHLQGWKINSQNEDSENQEIELLEFDESKAFHPVDDLDLMILQLTQNSISHNDLLHQMINALDEEAISMKDQFVQLIHHRITYFLTHKILAILPANLS